MKRRQFIKGAVATVGVAALGVSGIAALASLSAKEGKKMKVLVLTGSPRKNGNSNTLADVFASATRPGVLLICETWRDEAALAAHSASEPFVKNVAIINDCGEMKIEKFEM